MLKHTKGDLIAMTVAGNFDIILHGCNCFNVMGAGIAAQIATIFPDAKVADEETTRGDVGKLGTYTTGVVEDMDGDTVLVLNCYTQYSTATRENVDVFEYTAFERVLNKIALRFGDKVIGMPMIGMGLAGGDATRIHHGDCTGVDVQVAQIADVLGLRIICHPPSSTDTQGHYGGHEFREPKGYLARDRDIVDESDLLIVVPLQQEWQPRGGTWYTHDYAQKNNKPVKIFWPDGRISE
jgi:O-acetyl-ADP-ribose deacetylase (regulator of RNase III)